MNRDDVSPEELEEARREQMRRKIRETKNELRRLQGKPVIDEPEDAA